jgi:SLOG cluster3 family
VRRIFLSASVPLPDRDPRFFVTADVISIREAIKALTLVAIETRSLLVFGGHPAITPIVSKLFSQAGLVPAEHVILYQSEYFRARFPMQNSYFTRLVVTKEVDENRDMSLKLMRERMLGHCKFDVGIFIGGMDGVVDEFKLFRQLNPDAPVYPIASTGAAARMIWEQLPNPAEGLNDEYTYPTLFRKLLAQLN